MIIKIDFVVVILIIAFRNHVVEAFVGYFSQFHKYSLFIFKRGGNFALWKAKTPVSRYSGNG